VWIGLDVGNDETALESLLDRAARHGTPALVVDQPGSMAQLAIAVAARRGVPVAYDPDGVTRAGSAGITVKIKRRSPRVAGQLRLDLLVVNGSYRDFHHLGGQCGVAGLLLVRRDLVAVAAGSLSRR